MKNIFIVLLICCSKQAVAQNVSSEIRGVWMNDDLVSYYRGNDCDTTARIRPLYMTIDKSGSFYMQIAFEKSFTAGKLKTAKNEIYTSTTKDGIQVELKPEGSEKAILKIGKLQISLTKVSKIDKSFSIENFLLDFYLGARSGYYKKAILTKFNRQDLTFLYYGKMAIGNECLPLLVLKNPKAKDPNAEKIILGLTTTEDNLLLYNYDDHSIAYQLKKYRYPILDRNIFFNELVSLQSLNQSSFDSAVTNRGFGLAQKIHDDKWKSSKYVYVLSKSNDSPERIEHIVDSVSFGKENKLQLIVTVNYVLYNKQSYTDLLNECKKNGYLFFSSNNYDREYPDMIGQEYRKGALVAKFSTGRSKKESKEFYKISVSLSPK